MLIVVVIFMSNFTAKSLNNEKRTHNITRVSESPKIDGILNDPAWINATIAKDFIQFEPYNGKKPSLPTEVKVIYDDKAIYFGAILYDTNPDSIIKDLGERDDPWRINSDMFTVLLSTFNDGVNAFEFTVSASGIQSDIKHNADNQDENWDAVWDSKVKITDKGWIVEMKIPYSALRFSQKDIQSWGINFFRKIRRYRELSSWNFVDVNTQGLINQMGKIQGIKNINPPLRLSVSPYLSTYFNHDGESNNWNKNFNAGMDLKWGISQSFTLDMILIPDFSQVQSDDEILNLSAFEVRYDEKRQFFTEGTELFNKGGIFYSRRIGGRPKLIDSTYNDGFLNENEEIDENPITTKLINATKISGRTDFGLGIGFLNAMTGASDAIIQDTMAIKEIIGIDTSFYNKKRNYRTQGFTNYNMIVIDQSLKNNSYLSLANTNVMYDGIDYTANVTAAELKLMNKENSYQIFGRGALSQIYTDSTDLGHTYFFQFAKTKGNFLFEVSHNVESDTYDPNDMGFIRSNNESMWDLELSYNINKPFWKVLNWRNELSLTHSSLYKPKNYTDFNIRFHTNTTFTKRYLHAGLFVSFRPFEGYDYFEPRVDGWKYKRPKSSNGNMWISTDYRKVLAFDINFGGLEALDYDQYGYWFGIGPRIRFSDKWLLSYNMNIQRQYNSYGYIEDYEEELTGNTIINFGERDQSTTVNTLNTNYIFTNKMSLSLRVRHYWSKVKYSDFFTLQEDGSLSESIGYDTYGNEENNNYNAFTVDMKYLWRFAPGSELALVWKNAIYTNETDIVNNFVDNFNNTVFESSTNNSISFKILFYLDYQYLVKK